MPSFSKPLPPTRATGDAGPAADINAVTQAIKELRARSGTVADSETYGNFTVDATSHLQSLIGDEDGIVRVPAGTYKISSALNLVDGLRLVGDGSGATTIKQVNPAANALQATDQVHLSVENIRLEGPDSGTGRGISLTRSSNAATNYLVLDDVYVRTFGGAGIWASNAIVSTFTNVVTESNRGHGFHFIGEDDVAGTSVSFHSCYANNNLGSGFRLDTMAYCALAGCASEGHVVDYDVIGCLGTAFSGCGSERNKGKSWNIEGGYGTTITGGWVFMNDGIGVHIHGNSVGNTIIGLADTLPTANADFFVKSETGSKVVLSSIRTTAPNSLATGSAHVLADQALNARFGGSLNVPGQLTLNDLANLYAAANVDGTTPRVQTDQSLYVGNVLLSYGDMRSFGGLGVNGNDPVYKTAAPTGTTDAKVAALIATLQAVGLYS